MRVRGPPVTLGALFGPMSDNEWLGTAAWGYGSQLEFQEPGNLYVLRTCSIAKNEDYSKGALDGMRFAYRAYLEELSKDPGIL